MFIPKPGKANYTDKKAYQRQHFGATPPTWIPICLPTTETALQHVITYIEEAFDSTSFDSITKVGKRHGLGDTVC